MPIIDPPSPNQDRSAREINAALEAAGIRSRHEPFAGAGLSSVVGTMDSGQGRQRLVSAFVDAQGGARVFLTPPLDVPDGKSAEEMLSGVETPQLCRLSAGSPRPGVEVVRRIRWKISEC